ncbi:MAG TPA: glycosyltransferase family 2 protein [Chitinophagaceae bacterium]
MEKLSVVIITYNEEKNIGSCIDSVQSIADEIIVLDSFSSDSTIAIALQKGAKVFQSTFQGYIAQKNKAIEKATHNYILSIDADEQLDASLQTAIGEAKKTFTYGAYKMKRCTNYCGHFIRYGAWYPDRKIRLFDKRVAAWGGLDPHDKIVFSKTIAVKQLPGEILHYSYSSKEGHVLQNERFSTIVAESYYFAGKKTNWFKIIVNPFWAFVYGYFIRRGFLNGEKGLVIAFNQARYTFYKHKKLYALQIHGLKTGSDIQPSTHTDRLSGNIRAHV